VANKVIAGAVTDGQYERFEVYTGQQACALLNVSHVSTITARARTAAAKDNRTVVWLATAPGNTTSVNLFVAAWVDELVARNGGAKVKVRPVVMYLPRLLGMTDAAVSTTEPPSLPGEVVAPTPGPSPSRHPTADPLQDPANQLDLVRSEAAAERQAREDTQEALLKERDARHRDQLAERDRTIQLLTGLLEAGNRALDESQKAVLSVLSKKGTGDGP
jgi:hypothetical protein